MSRIRKISGPGSDIRARQVAKPILCTEPCAKRAHQFVEVLLMLSAAEHLHDTNTASVRAAMRGPPSTFNPPEHLLEIRDAWRCVEVAPAVPALARGVFSLDDA